MAGLQHNPIRHDWLATRTEAALEPALPVVDAHHHLYDRPSGRYLFQDMLEDVRASGHDVRATVFVQCRGMVRADGPVAMRPVGETEFANGAAAMSASGLYGRLRMCAGIVGAADLRLGDAVRPVLEAHLVAGGGTAGGRFRGVRDTATWDPDPALLNPAYSTTEDMLATPQFRAGFAHLAPLGLSFDAWLLFHQLPRLTELARAFPQTPIVVNHCGGIHAVGAYATRRPEVFAQWKAGLQALARCPNVMMKLGGLGMKIYGFGFEKLPQAPSSEQLADAWRPWVETCAETFGTDRCMVESNFDVDKGSYGYGIGLNAMKRIFSGASAQEKADVFWRSATRFYRLGHVPALAELLA
ncbi:amidohydrolase family protein [Pseudorhodoferax sp.]|uniref:amidohydrolase family protein n=1 Tax=Pseudorhodoferax sp. TaxID=1993553 RepID=UPI0039E4D5E8